MRRLTRLRVRLRRANRKRERVFRRFSKQPVGSDERGALKAQLARLRGKRDALEAQIKALLAKRHRVNWNGHPPIPSLAKYVAYATRYGLVVTSTSEGYPGDGVHTASSYHYQKRAVDLGGSWSDLVAVQNGMVNKWGAAAFVEVFGPASFYVKNGVRIASTGPFPGHSTHIHVAK